MFQSGAALCLSLLVSVSAPSTAVAWLGETELDRSCDTFLADPQSRDGALCLAFVQGFLAGADVTMEAAGSRKPGADTAEDESFSERAARTRLGTLRRQSLQEAGSADYCVDASIPADEIVRKITAHLRDREDDCGLTDAEAVREALVHNFPCDD